MRRAYGARNPAWSVRDLPDRAGRTYLVTGAGSGIGYFIAEQLASTGAEIVLAGRTAERLSTAAATIRGRVPEARLRSLVLDLADLASVRTAVTALDGTPLDGAVFNAGVLKQRIRRETADGHELVFGTNHLGHFALGALLLPLMAAGSRYVTMGSVAARSARLDLDGPGARQRLESAAGPYRGFEVYKRSKLAQMTSAFELDRRLRAAGSPVASVVAHPGGALDGLTPSRPPVHVRRAAAFLKAVPLAPLVQGKDAAAWPAVRALLDPEVTGGQLWGPRLARSRGRPVPERPTARMLDAATGRRLWSLGEEAVGLAWPGL
ncbi:SDR family NAD(P)-dependent oxidoreductase [Streptomyces sp. NPDC086091]|uniref:SDR family NAD(P)-dependent oxidoreductase n=1 Tax=Streptomyces sp. NPDC086091 TaxID=3365751 RepID=UPI00382DE2AE